MTINDRITMLHKYFDGCFNPNIEPNIELNSITYWNSLPVIHDKFAKRYLVVFTEKQFEDLLKHEEEEK